MSLSPVRSPSGSKQRASFAPCGTASWSRWARCACLSEHAGLVALACIVCLRKLCHTEFIEPPGRFAIGVGEVSRVHALVDFHHRLMIGEVLVREAHPCEELYILGEGVELAFAEALNIATHANGMFIPHLTAFIGCWQAPAVGLDIAPEVFFEELRQRLLQAIPDLQRGLAPRWDQLGQRHRASFKLASHPFDC